MAKFKNRGKNLTRAQAIIRGMQEEPENVPPTDEPVDEIIEKPVVEDTPQPEDTPPVETPIADSAPLVEEPPVETPVDTPQPEAIEITEELLFEKLSEMLGNEVNSLDDLKPKQVEIDPELKQLLDWKENTGLSLSQWSEYNKDFSKLSDLDIVKETLTQKYPNFSKEELDYELKDYIYNPDYDDEDDKVRKSIKLKKLASEGRAQLEKNKLELKPAEAQSSLTKEQKDLIDYAKQVQAQIQESEQNTQKYNDNLKLAASNLDTLSLQLDESINIEHKLDDAAKKDLPEFVNTMPHWYNEDGSPNHSNIALDGYKIKNFDALLKMAFEQGKSVGIENQIKGNGNVSLDPKATPQQGEEAPKGNIDEVVAKLTRSGNSGKFRFRKKK